MSKRHLSSSPRLEQTDFIVQANFPKRSHGLLHHQCFFLLSLRRPQKASCSSVHYLSVLKQQLKPGLCSRPFQTRMEMGSAS